MPTGHVNTIDLVANFTLLRTLTMQLSVVGGHDTLMAWSPADHSIAVSQGFDGFVWSADTGQTLVNLSSDRVDSLAFSPDGSMLALASSGGGVNGGGIRLVDPKTGEQKRFLPPSALDIPNYSMNAKSMAWSPTGNFLASVSEEVGEETQSALPSGTPISGDAYPQPVGVLHVWNVSTGIEAQTIRVPNDPSSFGGIAAIAWSPKGDVLAALLYGGALQLWDASTGQMLHRLATIRMYDLAHMEWSPDGRTLAVVAGRQVQLWDAASGKMLRSFRMLCPVTDSHPHAGLFGATGANVYRGGYCYAYARHAHCWAIRLQQCSHMLWSPDSHSLITADGGHIRLWDPNTGDVKLASTTLLTCWRYLRMACAGGFRIWGWCSVAEYSRWCIIAHAPV